MNRAIGIALALLLEWQKIIDEIRQSTSAVRRVDGVAIRML